MKRRAGLLAPILSLGIMFPVRGTPKSVEVKMNPLWVDTEMDFAPREKLRITAEGSLLFTEKRGIVKAGPAGLARTLRDVIRNYPVNGSGRGALIGKFGEKGLPFLVGVKWEGHSPVKGRLLLGINQSGGEQAEGSFVATIERIAPAPAPPDPSKLNLPAFPQELLDQIPARVEDPKGNPGDRVNFLLIGSKEQVQAALMAAGWVVVDKDSRSAILQGVFDTLSGRSYLTMPMSILMLFGKPQDFGYAKGDPVRVVASRHHFRLWEAPFDLQGTSVWVGAGTHDVGFDKDQRDGKITHKIDPDTDKERDYVGETLSQTGMVARSLYMTAKDTVKEAETAHGQTFRSDGRTLIIYLTPGHAGKT